ncbi:zinc protease [Mucilaginibacter gracilis]|uniref:Zinc protease n=1 Tax=Mucilaginibacter gracilis TaxID=423350 RepID=A0A495IZR3_9SPHI|nr:M16 family metallopeptidase [Mucilaginibacter gracilis]RKR81524.1 zinc protease [Mucilaginibacter gracilis]
MKLKLLLAPAILLSLVVNVNLSLAQTRPVPSPKSKPEPITNQLTADNLLPADTAVIIGKLPNGLTYYIRKNTFPKNRAELYLVNKVGSVLENDEQQGLAHFTEHMAFNGTKDFPKNQLVNYLQKSGVRFGADLNAYTSFDETVYQLPLPTDSAKTFNQGFNILANWAGMVSFDTDEINAERGVVLEEKRLNGKNAQERMSKITMPVLLNNSRYADRLTIGKEEILNNFKPETIKSFYHDWYRPDLQAVIAVGDFDPQQVEQLIKTNFSALKNPDNERPRTQYDIPPGAGTTVKIVTDKEQPYTTFQMIVKHPGNTVKTGADFLQAIRIQLFNSLLNARIGELTQKADPPFLNGDVSYADFVGNLDAFTTEADAKPGELEKAVKAIVAETERARKFGFTQTEFERAKQMLLTGVENAWKEKDKTNSVNYVTDYQQNFLKGDAIISIDFEYDFYKQYIGQIKLSEINALAGMFISEQNCNIIVEAPDNEKDKLPTEQILLGWIKAAGNNVTPYVDNVSNKPLLEKQPQGSIFVRVQTDAAIGTNTLTLGNGVKVILKPTNFKNDEILINSFSLGGTSLATDADYTSADMAAGIISSSGIADIDQIKLDKMLTGKNAAISPYINETSQGINGRTSPEDIETALQLIYLYYTQPRRDDNIWQSVITQYRAALTNRGLDPEMVYADTSLAVLGDHNIRRMNVTTDRLNTASLDKAFAFYKARFADASNTIFTLTGNFSAAAIKPLLEKYLGALPSLHHNEQYRNLDIHIPERQITATVHKGIGDKSTVQMVFSGSYVYSNQNNIQLDAIGEILQIKLNERLREKESGVYSPEVTANYNKLPASRYSIVVYFSCAPANVDKLIAATMDEIAKIKQNGAEPTDIQKFIAETQRSNELRLKENAYWLGYLSQAIMNGDNPDDILMLNKYLGQITVQSTKQTANQCLSGNNLIKLILLPEAPAKSPTEGKAKP